MANDFLTNLRATRAGSKERTPSSKSLITRGDIQKGRQEQSSIAPNSFLNFLRMVMGMQEATKGKEQLNVEDVPAKNIDRMSPEDEEAYIEHSHSMGAAAKNGTLDVEHDLNKYNAAANGSIDIPYAHSDFKNAYGVLENYDALNKVLDEYDNINTWSGKQVFLRNAYKRFDDKHGDIGRWFNRLYNFTLEAKQYHETDPRKVTDAMRQLNENIKKMMLHQA